MSLRLGLAGVGLHGARYARHLLQRDVAGARLTAVCRADAVQGRAFAAEHGVAFVADPRELAVHPDVDAVLLALPPDLHPAAAEACLRNGRPVLVEKPLAPDAASARAVAQLVQQTGTFLMVAQTLRFDPLVEALRLEIAGLGRLRSVYINQRFEPHDRSWLDTPGRGGMVLNTGVHGFDLLRFLTGLEATHVQAELTRALTRNTEDLFAAIFRLDPGGVIAVVDNSRSSRSRSGRIEIVGEEGQVWGDHIHRTLERVRGTQLSDIGPVPAVHTLPVVLQAFTAAVSAGGPSPVTADDGVAAAEMIDAVLRSAREERRIRLDELPR